VQILLLLLLLEHKASSIVLGDARHRQKHWDTA
jgi:hypothetical protein